MNKNNVLLGSVLGSILGTVGAALIPEGPKGKNWSDSARKAGEKLLSDIASFGDLGSDSTKNFIAGALVGLLVGAGSTALFTPKTGKQLRKNVSNQYQNVAGKTQEIIDLISSYAAKPGVRKAVRKVRNAVGSKVRDAVNSIGATVTTTRKVTRKRAAAKSASRGRSASKRTISRSRSKTRSKSRARAR